MSTHSNIAVQQEDGSFSVIYCHFDGYPGHVGKILHENYSDIALARELVSFGDMSYIEAKVENCCFYTRDRGESPLDTKPQSHENLDALLIYHRELEYLYILQNDNEWLVRKYRNEPQQLSQVLPV